MTTTKEDEATQVPETVETESSAADPAKAQKEQLSIDAALTETMKNEKEKVTGYDRIVRGIRRSWADYMRDAKQNPEDAMKLTKAMKEDMYNKLSLLEGISDEAYSRLEEKLLDKYFELQKEAAQIHIDHKFALVAAGIEHLDDRKLGDYPYSAFYNFGELAKKVSYEREVIGEEKTAEYRNRINELSRQLRQWEDSKSESLKSAVSAEQKAENDRAAKDLIERMEQFKGPDGFADISNVGIIEADVVGNLWAGNDIFATPDLKEKCRDYVSKAAIGTLGKEVKRIMDARSMHLTKLGSLQEMRDVSLEHYRYLMSDEDYGQLKKEIDELIAQEEPLAKAEEEKYKQDKQDE